MNKSRWLIVLVVIISLVIYFGHKAGGLLSTGQSLRELLALGLDQRCVVTQETDEGQSDSVAYISGDKLRSDLRYVTPEQTTSAHIVIMDDYIYTWVDNFNLGLKTPIADTTNEPDASSVSVDQKFDYQCEAWTVEQAAFNLPPDIQFIEVN